MEMKKRRRKRRGGCWLKIQRIKTWKTRRRKIANKRENIKRRRRRRQG